VAQELGVSHQASYVHFARKRRFLAAVAGTGLQQAGPEAFAALAEAGEDPLRRLHVFADAYITFIRARPHVHDLAHGPLVAKADHPLLQQAAIAYWDLLHDTVARCPPVGVGEVELLRRCAAIWGRSMASHGWPRSARYPGRCRAINGSLPTRQLGLCTKGGKQTVPLTQPKEQPTHMVSRSV
jgi:AcrR family transcriptional regulator